MTWKSYPAYKPSGVNWLGDVPKGWEVKRLKLTTRLTDRKVEANEDNPLSYVGLENIESWTGRIVGLNVNTVPTGTANAFKARNTLFGKLRPYLAKACNPDFDGLCSTELLVMEGIEYDRRALLYALLSDGFIRLVDSSTYGSKMPRANWDFIGNCVLPVPQLPEQRAIADFLDRETGKIDRLVAKKRELIEKLREERAALISEVVTGKRPIPTGRDGSPNRPRGRQEDGRLGEASLPKMKPSGVEWFGDVPERWEVKRLSRCAFFQEGPGLRNWQFMQDGIRVICVTNITDTGISFSNYEKFVSQEEYGATYRHFTVAKGDLLLSSSGNSWGKVATYDADDVAILNTSTIRVNENACQTVDPEFAWLASCVGGNAGAVGFVHDRFMPAEFRSIPSVARVGGRSILTRATRHRGLSRPGDGEDRPTGGEGGGGHRATAGIPRGADYGGGDGED